MTAGDTQTNQLAILAQGAFRVVEQGIRFERAMVRDAKTGFAQQLPDFSQLAWQTQLDFDFDLQSDTLIRRKAVNCPRRPGEALSRG